MCVVNITLGLLLNKVIDLLVNCCPLRVDVSNAVNHGQLWASCLTRDGLRWKTLQMRETHRGWAQMTRGS